MTHMKIAAAVCGALALTGGAAGACTLQTVGELNVDLSRGAPVVDGEINGVAVKVMIDTGAVHTIITRTAATALGLVGRRLPDGYVFQIGGQTESYAANIKSLKIGTLTANDLPPMLIAGDLKGRSDVSMLVGADFLSQFDVELDLGEHMIRLFKAQDCQPGQLVYWNKPYSQAALVAPSGAYAPPQIQVEILLNGHRATAEVDTGAARTVVDAGVAAAAGEPPPAHPELAGGGLGPALRPTWTDEFASIAIGDENIAHAHVEVMDFAKDFQAVEEAEDTRVAQHLTAAPLTLIGDDFLEAHRVMADFKDHVMVFSYNGGPIFSAAAATSP